MNQALELQLGNEELAVSTRCDTCGKLFLKLHKGHRFCSDSCRYKSTDRVNPRYIAKTRERCDRWYRERNPDANKVVSLSGAPVIGPYLPGGAVVIRFRGGHVPPLCRGRHIHAAVTNLLSVPHDSLLPTFATSPYGDGWGVYSPDLDTIRTIAGIRDVVRIGDERHEIATGPLMRLRAPTVTKRGWRLLRIDTVTPVVIRSTSSKTGKTVVRQLGIATLLKGSLTTFAKLRLGLDIGDRICCEVVESEVTRDDVQLSGKEGNVRGFSGSLVVRCNAVGEWLLRAAEQISIGGRVGFGFGRIRVSEHSVDKPAKTGAAGKFFVTPHAVKRYIQRVHPSASYEQALSEIIREAEGAHFVKQCDHTDLEEASDDELRIDEAELWRTGRPLRLRLIVGKRNPGLPQIVTVLPGTT